MLLEAIDGGWNVKEAIYPRVFLPKIEPKESLVNRVRRIVINGAAEPITFEQRAQR